MRQKLKDVHAKYSRPLGWTTLYMVAGFMCGWSMNHYYVFTFQVEYTDPGAIGLVVHFIDIFGVAAVAAIGLKIFQVVKNNKRKEDDKA